MRFAILESKMGIVALLSKYSLLKTENTPEKMVFDVYSTLGAPRDELWVRAERRRRKV